MKRELLMHFLALFLFSAVVFLVNRWFEARYLVFLIGGVIGTLLPDLDHLVYVYLLKPQELNSQRVNSMLARGQLLPTLSLLSDTRSERKHLIFHTIFFQMLFFALIIFIFTSSSSLFGKGLVVAFGLHLFVDQLVDYVTTGGLSNWFSGNTSLVAFFDRDKTFYFLVAIALSLLILAILL